jgi:hypothetical protein
MNQWLFAAGRGASQLADAGGMSHARVLRREFPVCIKRRAQEIL